MKLTLGISPCPNDTFIFDALVNGAIDTGDLRFEVALEDVQTLNEWAMAGKLDVSKVSYGVLPEISPRYAVLSSGGALGRGVGPLLVSRRGLGPFRPDTMTVAIPGRQTTAHLLFSLAHPTAARKQFMVFSAIEEAVLSGAADAGVIIHEGRFTFADKGLAKLQDLGEYWERTTGGPDPARRNRRASHPRAGGPARSGPPRARERRARAGAPPGGERVGPGARAGDGRGGHAPAHRSVRERVLGGPRPRRPRGGPDAARGARPHGPHRARAPVEGVFG